MIRNYSEVIRELLSNLDFKKIDEFSGILKKAHEEGNSVFVIGNGGSAASSSHFVCDLGKGTVMDFESKNKRFKVMSLCDNNSLISAYGNDLGYKYIFSEQLKNFASNDDVLIAISASGNSPNIMRAVETAKNMGVKVIGLSGFSGGRLKEFSDLNIHINNNHYGQVEDLHMMILHMVAYDLKEILNN